MVQINQRQKGPNLKSTQKQNIQNKKQPQANENNPKNVVFASF